MILLRTFLLITGIVQILTAPNLPRTIARIGEVRARNLANRARLRANTARLFHPRSKRQENAPQLLHICPTGDDSDEMRDAEDEDHFARPEHLYYAQDEQLRQNQEEEDEETPQNHEISLPEEETTPQGPHIPTIEEIVEQLREAEAHLHSHSILHHHSHHHIAPFVPSLNVHVNQHHSSGLHHQTTGILPNLHPGMHSSGFAHQTSGFLPHSSSSQQLNTLNQVNNGQGLHSSGFHPHSSSSQQLNNLNQVNNAQIFTSRAVKDQNGFHTPVFDPFDQQTQVMHFLNQHQSHSFHPFSRESSMREIETIEKELEELREAEEAEMRREDADLASPYLLDMPERRSDERFRREDPLASLLRAERKAIDSLLEHPHDENLNLIHSISNNILSDLEKNTHAITKRNVPLAKLIVDPKVKLDVPKTLENFGTVTKHAFEDEKAPMYHVKHLLGSSRNALLSAMRIPPQNMIIPSEYEIVKNDEIVGGIAPSLVSKMRHVSESEDDPLGFSQTFSRVGEMIRESIKSGQDTATHLSEMANDARNILHTARRSAPRLIVPYSRVTAIQDSRPKPAVLITPRILDITQKLGKKPASDKMVRLGQLMDAVGVSNPASKKFYLDKIIFEPRQSTMKNLEDAKISVGAQNLKEFLVKMRSELVHEPQKEHRKRFKKIKQNQEVGKFVETLFDGSREKNETVGTGLYLAPYLMHPFMERPSKGDLEKYHHENGYEPVVGSRSNGEGEVDEMNEYLRSRMGEESVEKAREDQSDLGYVLGAINPLMFERMYNRTVKVGENPQTSFKPHRHSKHPNLGDSFEVKH